MRQTCRQSIRSLALLCNEGLPVKLPDVRTVFPDRSVVSMNHGTLPLMPWIEEESMALETVQPPSMAVKSPFANATEFPATTRRTPPLGVESPAGIGPASVSATAMVGSISRRTLHSCPLMSALNVMFVLPFTTNGFVGELVTSKGPPLSIVNVLTTPSAPAGVKETRITLPENALISSGRRLRFAAPRTAQRLEGCQTA